MIGGDGPQRAGLSCLRTLGWSTALKLSWLHSTLPWPLKSAGGCLVLTPSVMDNHQKHPSGSSRDKSGRSHDQFTKEAAAILKQHGGSSSDMKTLLQIATQQMLAERQRATAAEVQFRDLSAKMKEVNEAKRRAMREAERAVTLLKYANSWFILILNTS